MKDLLEFMSEEEKDSLYFFLEDMMNRTPSSILCYKIATILDDMIE